MTPPRRYTACLLDVYETVLTFDSGSHLDALADIAGVDAVGLGEALTPWHARLNDGRASVREALAGALSAAASREASREASRQTSRDATGEPRGGAARVDDALLDRLVAEDRRLLLERAVVPADVVPSLERLRARDVRTALVSNCADNTRPVLEALGLADRVDEVVLSCEVGAAKPDALVYETALVRLGVGPGEAVFVDDQPRFCDGAQELGIRAVRIDRGGGGAEATTLEEVTGLF